MVMLRLLLLLHSDCTSLSFCFPFLAFLILAHLALNLLVGAEHLGN
jgi:hypothetical protein